MAKTTKPAMIPATVRQWSPEGWGVLDCIETPGGCWVHWSMVHRAGDRELHPGQVVKIHWEKVDQDGYQFRATKVIIP